MNSVEKRSSVNTKDLIESALLIALVYVATAFINIRLPILANGGLVHLGTVMLIISALVFGSKKGAIAGAFGMGIFDLLSGWTIWAPFTFVIRGIMGFVIGKIAYSKNNDGNNLGINILAVLVGAIVMISGYYIAEIILYGNWVAPLTSIPGNIVQNVVGLILGMPIAKVLKRYSKYL